MGQVKIKYAHGDLGDLGHGHGYHFVIFLRYGTKTIEECTFLFLLFFAMMIWELHEWQNCGNGNLEEVQIMKQLNNV